MRGRVCGWQAGDARKQSRRTKGPYVECTFSLMHFNVAVVFKRARQGRDQHMCSCAGPSH